MVLASGALSAKPALLTSTSTAPSSRERRRHRGLVGDVADDRAGMLESPQRLRVAPERDHVVAERREPLDDRQADPLGAAGDHDRPAHLRDHRHQPLHLRQPLGVAPDQELQRHVLDPDVLEARQRVGDLLGRAAQAVGLLLDRLVGDLDRQAAVERDPVGVAAGVSGAARTLS